MFRRIFRSGIFGGALLAAVAASAHGPADVQTFKITATRFKFQPNEITVKKGQPVELDVTSADVNHGLVVQGLGVKIDVPKGKTGEAKFTPAQAGTFEGKCAHFCGSGHGTMKFTVHVVE